MHFLVITFIFALAFGALLSSSRSGSGPEKRRCREILTASAWLFKFKPSFERIKVNIESRALCSTKQPGHSSGQYPPSSHFTAWEEGLLEHLGTSEMDVAQEKCGRRENFAFSQQSSKIQSGATRGHTECPVLFIKQHSSCYWKQEAERCLATRMKDSS